MTTATFRPINKETLYRLAPSVFATTLLCRLGWHKWTLVMVVYWLAFYRCRCGREKVRAQ